jgi:hypothetical protein
MKTAYTILEPGPAGDKLITLEWVDVELKGTKDNPDEPSYGELKRLLVPILSGPLPHIARKFERVSIHGHPAPVNDCPVDMFVDDMSAREGMQLNDAATVLYWMNSILREVTPTTAYPEGSDMEAVITGLLARGVDLASQRLTTDTTTPRIHGRAILFRDRVWF